MSVRSRARQVLQTSIIAFTVCLGQACHQEVAQVERTYAGPWVMTLEQRVFIVLTIERHGQAFAARILAPASFELPQPLVQLVPTREI